jgi:hypothetical protein
MDLESVSGHLWLTAAAGAVNSEATIGIALLADDDTAAGPVEALADSAYGTGEALAALAAAGHTPVINRGCARRDQRVHRR